eukprot:m.554976 g.554976  ORF g.554976 m.554976 type:complete len:385 (+) comp22179_c1_seq2:1824-2978(+)
MRGDVLVWLGACVCRGADVAEGRGDAWVGVSDTDDVAWREIVPGLRVRTRSTSSQSSLSSASSADDTTAANFPPLASPPSRQRPHVAVVKAPVPGDTSVTDNMHALDNMHAPDNIRAPDNMHTTDAAWEDIQGSSWGARRETGSSLSSWGSAGASPTGSILAYPGHTTAFAGSVASPHNVTVGFDVVPPPPVFGTANGAFESTAPRSNSSAPEGDAVMSLGAEAGGKVHVREPSRGKGCHAGSSDGVYTFYQSVDAQPVFLHSLNMRCLLHEYGNGNTDDAVDVCPAEVGGEVVEVLRHTMTDELRRRFRYLAHLPVVLLILLAAAQRVSHAPSSIARFSCFFRGFFPSLSFFFWCVTVFQWFICARPTSPCHVAVSRKSGICS